MCCYNIIIFNTLELPNTTIIYLYEKYERLESFKLLWSVGSTYIFFFLKYNTNQFTGVLLRSHLNFK